MVEAITLQVSTIGATRVVSRHIEMSSRVSPLKKVRARARANPMSIGYILQSSISPKYVTCSECQKLFTQPHKLRKHMKRHTKPYGCTFSRCFKRFGSLADWMRHENSQHEYVQSWRCDIECDGRYCGYLEYDQERFGTHLDTTHNIPIGTKESRKTCLDMHYFWCGFCTKLIGQNEGTEPRVCDVRHKHIGDHFNNNELIDDWVGFEGNHKQKLVNRGESNKEGKVDVEDSNLGNNDSVRANDTQRWNVAGL